MYILPIILLRLMILVILYILIILTWWDYFGFWTMLFSLVPGIALVYIFGYPFLVFISLMGSMFLSMFVLDISITPFFYSQTFWGVQIFILFIFLAIALYKTYRIPKGSLKKQRSFKHLHFSSEEMIVILNPSLHIIEKVSSATKKLYGWKKSELEGKSLSMIYIQDIFENPPKDFWESLHVHHQWCGVVEIITKDNVICEEIAVYTAVFDDDNNIVLIEKKILEIFVKYYIPYKTEWYTQLYEELPIPIAVINKNYQIELANTSFLKKFMMNIVFQKTNFFQLFSEELQERLKIVLYECFSNGIVEEMYEQIPFILNDSQELFKFSPYFCSKTRTVSHLLLTILPSQIYSNAQTRISHNQIQEYTSISMGDLLKNSITEWYINDNKAAIKLYTVSSLVLDVSLEVWEPFLYSLFNYVEKNKKDLQKKLLISCTVLYFQYFFKISFLGVPYSSISEDNMEEILEKVQSITSNYYFEQGNRDELVLVLEFFHTPFDNKSIFQSIF